VAHGGFDGLHIRPFSGALMRLIRATVAQSAGAGKPESDAPMAQFGG